MSAKAAQQLNSGAEGVFLGGARYEQMFRAAGVLRVGGEEQAFTGQGMRVRRLGLTTRASSSQATALCCPRGS